MHNDAVLTNHLNRRLALSVVSLLVAGSALAGCSGSDSDDKAETAPSSSGSSGSSSSSGGSSTSPSESASATPYLPVPAGVELTTPGSGLEVGDAAVVAYNPRQGTVGALSIKVTRLERTTFAESFKGWQLNDQIRKSKPYFVRATVTNVGNTDLGGRVVPLYIVDGTNTLIEPTSFKSSFAPCQPGNFAKKFPTGRTQKVCLVYLAPAKGDLVSVSFRPTQEFDPITWTGELQAPQKPGQKGGKKGGQGKGKGKGKGQG